MKIDKQAVEATIRTVAAVLALIAARFGWQFDESLFATVAILAIGGVYIVYACWKNQNFTKAAQVAQEVTTALKNGSIKEKDVEKLLNK